MPLIPYEPFQYLDDMRRELDRLFAGGELSNRGFPQHFGAPRVDVFETENEVVATCDLPGLEKKEDVNIDIDHNNLTITGTINRISEIKQEHMHRRERYMGHFQRSIPLPARVSSEGAKATYKNGVLEIRMPKLASDTRKRIDIDFH